MSLFFKSRSSPSVLENFLYSVPRVIFGSLLNDRVNHDGLNTVELAGTKKQNQGQENYQRHRFVNLTNAWPGLRRGFCSEAPQTLR